MTTASAPPGDAPRRSTAPAPTAVGELAELWRVPVTYGAVGATQAPDLLRYPPRGYRPYERTIRVGHGPERWEYAWMRVMSWGGQRGAGLEVTPVDAPAAATEASYVPVAFDADGTPIAIPGIVPKLSDTPGSTRWLGPDLGAHTAEVLATIGIEGEELEALRRDGVV